MGAAGQAGLSRGCLAWHISDPRTDGRIRVSRIGSPCCLAVQCYVPGLSLAMPLVFHGHKVAPSHGRRTPKVFVVEDFSRGTALLPNMA
jgi:hypothetical protein